MPQATFSYGDNIQTMDYTPASAVASGDVVVLGDIVGISLLAIAAGQLGALNISGGVYDVLADAAIAIGAIVYWNDATNQVTATAGANKFMGHLVTASAGVNGACKVAHRAGGKT